MAAIRRFEIVSAMALPTQPSSSGLIGGSSTPRPFASITSALEYWIARRSLSAGGALRRPVGGRRRWDVCLRSRDTIRPSFANSVAQKRGRRRPSREGAGKTGCALHPRSRVQRQRERRTRAYRFSGSSPAFPAQWFYDLLRALPGDRLFCHHRRCDAKHHHQLDASNGASGPHDFAVRVSAVRQKRIRVHRIPTQRS
jgi:hypothetical protein